MINLIFIKSTQNILFFFLLVCFTVFLKTDVTCAQSSKDSGKQPLHVVSDKMIAQKDSSMVEFIGNVKAVQENSIVWADSIKIFFNNTDEAANQDNKYQSNSKKADDTENQSDARSNVKKIISTGNVKFISEERKAFADKAVYTTKDDILVLTGKSPKLLTGSSFVTGKKITLFRKLGQVIVESDGKQRVEALFNPEDNTQPENGFKKDSSTKNSGQDKQ